jgi:16S rRNA (cytidine1402-2'-O)-methyltransferase
MPRSLEPGLYITGTPIGNLEDVSARALRILGGVDCILAEDTRQTRKLLARYDLRTPLMSCHKFNEASRVEGIRERVERGEALALVTDSGMPGISDPGARTVSACREAGVPTWVGPGPCSVSSALALSGMPADRYSFYGFLPVKPGARGRFLEEIAADPHTAVLFESPHRIMKLLEQLEASVPQRLLVIGRELTKRFEEAVTGTPGEVRRHFSDRAVKGEFVVVIAPAGRKAR